MLVSPVSLNDGRASDVDLVRSSKDSRIICLHLKMDVTSKQSGYGLSEQDQIVPLLRGCQGTNNQVVTTLCMLILRYMIKVVQPSLF
jgi:hypothetical protein